MGQEVINRGVTRQAHQSSKVNHASYASSHFGFRVWLLIGVFWTFTAQNLPSGEAQTTTPTKLPEVTVRGTTPLMSVPLPEKDIPANVQVATDEDYRSSGALNLTDFLSRDLAGISLTHVQNNPFQPDVLYRGFTSSFLLGTPPGLSVLLMGPG